MSLKKEENHDGGEIDPNQTEGKTPPSSRKSDHGVWCRECQQLWRGKTRRVTVDWKYFLYFIWLELNSLLTLKMSNLLECKTCFSLNPKHHRLVFFLNEPRKSTEISIPLRQKFLGKEHLHANICLHEEIDALKSNIIKNVFYYVFMGFSFLIILLWCPLLSSI